MPQGAYKLTDAKPIGAFSLADAQPVAEPAAPEPSRFSSALSTAKDLGIGALKGAAHTALDLGEAAGNLPNIATGGTLRDAVDELYGTPGISKAAFPAAREDMAYTNPTQQIGGALETGAEMLVPVGEAASAIPNAARAGRAFNDVAKVANKLPVDTSAIGNVALRIADFAQHGGGTQWGPAPVRQFIQYMADPKKAPLTYEVAREFASNISKLSVNEAMKMSPVIAKEVAELRVVTNRAIADVASKAGKGAEYAKAMNEYAKAKKLSGLIDTAIDSAQKGVPYGIVGGSAAAVGGGAYWLTKQMLHLLGGD
jgi:hypothetical protein